MKKSNTTVTESEAQSEADLASLDKLARILKRPPAHEIIDKVLKTYGWHIHDKPGRVIYAAGIIRDNEYTLEEFCDCAKAEGFINRIPEDLRTMIGDVPEKKDSWGEAFSKQAAAHAAKEHALQSR